LTACAATPRSSTPFFCLALSDRRCTASCRIRGVFEIFAVSRWGLKADRFAGRDATARVAMTSASSQGDPRGTNDPETTVFRATIPVRAVAA